MSYEIRNFDKIANMRTAKFRSLRNLFRMEAHLINESSSRTFCDQRIRGDVSIPSTEPAPTHIENVPENELTPVCKACVRNADE